jgi:hypothetical protein
LKERGKMNKGDIVRVYRLAVSKSGYRGRAKLIEFIKTLDYKRKIEMWKVEFTVDGIIDIVAIQAKRSPNEREGG